MQVVPINVVPTLPAELKRLDEIARNIWLFWNPEAIRLFQRLDRGLWEEAGHNPVKLLGLLDQHRIDELLADEGFMDQLDRVHRAFQRYMTADGAYSFHLERPADYTVAYLSAEYGLAECLPLYSGGLGVLSGDHLKSASDIRIPLVAVGLLYREGYFRQQLNAEGWQTEKYPQNDFATMPVEQIMDEKGNPIEVTVELAGRDVRLYVWKIQVGRVPLYMLDANVPGNPPDVRAITGQLYGGDREMRLRQEIVLGIGGVRALRRLGIHPYAYHMNEGHSAFATLERIRRFMHEEGLSFREAAEYVRATSIFTTHTPVPAGNDTFSPDLIHRYFAVMARDLGLSMDDLMRLGRIDPRDEKSHFGMTVLAFKFAAWANAVSVLHGRVARDMWVELWPSVPREEIPIEPLTNGIHVPSWISYEMGALYDRYLGPRWSEDPDNEKVWERAKGIPDSELWRTHERRRERLVGFARHRLEESLKRRGAPANIVAAARGALHPEALTIGFARRFATYKRAVLIFSDPDRLERILNSPERPVQLIIAGKAHPADQQGKEFIRQIVQFAREPRFRQRIVFLEDYDMNVARYLVQGADVWLNNPRRPLEACGTSGMKAAANGALNVSILDGWWDEAYDGQGGWAIGSGEELDDEAYQDAMEANALYDLIENEVVPTFYDRGLDGLPRQWIERMRHGLMKICPVFNTHRMVEDYMERFYHPAASTAAELRKNDWGVLKKLSGWKEKFVRNWPGLRVIDVTVDPERQVAAYSPIRIRARVVLGDLAPDDVLVQAWYGPLDLNDHIARGAEHVLTCRGVEDGLAHFEGEVRSERTGRFGVALRVLPKHEHLAKPIHLNLIRWA